jgi:hypothetical protein
MLSAMIDRSEPAFAVMMLDCVIMMLLPTTS